jgi:hypothetical protein
MSETEQEKAAQSSGVPASPGHQAGPPPSTDEPTPTSGRQADEAGAGHPDGIEPHAGTDK